MNPQQLFVEETLDDSGDILWSYGTRDRTIVGCCYDYRTPERVAQENDLTIRFVVNPRGW